jgi:hypothetical protein
MIAAISIGIIIIVAVIIAARDHLLHLERIASVAASTGPRLAPRGSLGSPELSNPVGSLEVGEHEEVEQLGAGAGPRVSRRSRSRRSSSSGFSGRRNLRG